MRRISATSRIAISLTCLTVSMLITAKVFGLIPDEREAVMRGRGRICEAVAIHSSLLLIRNDVESLRTTLQLFVDRDPDILSIALRRAETNQLLLSAGDHEKHWVAPVDEKSTETHMLVPLKQRNQMWGNVEVSYCPVAQSSGAALFAWPTLSLIVYLGSFGLAVYYVYLRLVLRQLNPNKVVPGRVREALNTLAEGLLIVDGKGQIVLANDAFVKTSGQDRNELLGRDADSIPWIDPPNTDDETPGATERPWTRAFASGTPTSGNIMQLESDDEARTYLVNSTPIFDPHGNSRGALASFEDITSLEKKKTELSELVSQLRQSSAEIRRKNEELTRLATRDPLTDCLNRRSFFEQFEKEWEASERYGYPLSAIMVDIDHFKRINDTHGHAVGDEVLQQVATALTTSARDSDVVCRYGGEEFSIILPHADIASAQAAAEKFRVAIETLEFSQLELTASLGVSCTGFGSTDPQMLLDQADRSLYFSKRSGRNQVARFDKLPTNLEIDALESSVTHPVVTNTAQSSIPFHAVTALIAALGYRNQATAEHSRRVADLCVRLGEGLMSRRDCYILEIAALLHDIGKVAVPDSVLRKTGKLTDDERAILRRHDLIGSEIVRSSFQSPPLSAIVDNFRNHFDGSQPDGAVCGNEISLGARILAIADFYDSLTHDGDRRDSISAEAAFGELRERKGSQFDPQLVEMFISNARLPSYSATPVVTMSTETSLRIGLQLERLATALDDHDLDALQLMAERIHDTAAREGVNEIAETAAQLERYVKTNCDPIEILHRANELMHQCRAARGNMLDQELVSS